MADYQLPADPYGYHAGYPTPPNAMSQQGQSQAGIPGMPPMPGQPLYHSLGGPRAPYPGGPGPSPDPLAMSHKMHPGYGSPYGPQSAAAASSLRASQYSAAAAAAAAYGMPPPQAPGPPGLDSYSSGLGSMGQAPPPPSHLTASGYGSSMMSQYGTPPTPQRMPHTPSPVRHPSMPSQYGSSSPYSSTSQSSAYGSAPPGATTPAGSDLWSPASAANQSMSPFGGFSSSVPPSSASTSSRSSQFPGPPDYSSGSYLSGHGMFPPSTGPDPYSSYPGASVPGLSGIPTSLPQSQAQSTTASSSSASSSSAAGRGSSSRSASSSSVQAQQQSSQQYPYGGSVPSSLNSASASLVASSRFGHYPSPYGPSAFDPTGQSRLSPYPPVPVSSAPASPSQYGRGGQASAGYAPSSGQSSVSGGPSTPLPMNSPRRPPATSPAGSPMPPPSSITPGPPSVGSSSNPGSAFSMPGAGSASAGSGNGSLAQLEQMLHLSSGGSNSSVNTKVNGNSGGSSLSPPSQKSGAGSGSMFQPSPASSAAAQYSSQAYASPYSQPHSGSGSQGQVSGTQTWQPPPPPMNTHSMKSKQSHDNDQAYSNSSSQFSSSQQNSSSTPTHNSSVSHMSQPYSPYDSKSLSSPAASGGMLTDKSDHSSSSVPWAPYNQTSYSSSLPPPSSSAQSRFDPISGQYGMIPSSQPPQSEASPYDHNASLGMYDPYNIDNQMPDPGSMSYRNDGASQQQMPPDYDPYAANFDDFETTGKKKGKGRPKKEPTPKKERKPRTPKAPGSGRGRGRGRGAKSAERMAPLPPATEAPNIPPPGMMPDFEDYGNFDPMSMYGNGSAGIPPAPSPMDSMYPLPPGPPGMSSTSQQQLPQSSSKMMSPLPDTNGLMSSHPVMPPPTTSFPGSGMSAGMMTGAPPPPQIPSQSPSSVSSIPPPPQSSASMSPSASSLPPMSGLSAPNGPSSMLGTPYPPSTIDSLGPKVSENNANYSTGYGMQSSGPPSVPSHSAPLPGMSPVNMNDSLGIKPMDHSSSSTGNATHMSPGMSSMGCDNIGKEAPPPPPPSSSQTSTMNDEPVSAFQPSRPFEDSYSMPPPPPLSVPVQAKPSLYNDVIDPNLRPKSEYDPTGYDSYSTKVSASVQQQQPSIVPQSQSTMPFDSRINENGESDSYSVMNQSYDSMSNTQSSMMTEPDYSSQYQYDQSYDASSTPVPEKEKKPKKRRSKKKKTDEDDEQPSESIKEESIVDDSLTPVVEEKKPKKKRSKKPKKDVENADTSLDTTVDIDKTLDDTMASLDSTLPEADVSVKPKKPRKRKKKVKEEPTEEAGEMNDSAEKIDIPAPAEAEEPVLEEPYILPPEEKKPKVKNKSPKKKLPKMGIKLKQSKKKKRGFGSDNENSDMEHTPPPSPKGEEDDNLKRRSSRNTKRTRYNDTLDIDLSDEEFLQKKEEEKAVENVQLTEDTMVVEKILQHRMGKRELELDETDEKKDGDQPPEPVFIDVEEFYVKYKNLSYLHCDWKTEEELEQGDRRVGPKIKRYRQKKDMNMFDFLDDELFNPDYVEVDRVLDVNEIEEMVEDIDEEEEQARILAECKKEQESTAKPKSPAPATVNGDVDHSEIKTDLDDEKVVEKEIVPETEVKTEETPKNDDEVCVEKEINDKIEPETETSTKESEKMDVDVSIGSPKKPEEDGKQIDEPEKMDVDEIKECDKEANDGMAVVKTHDNGESENDSQPETKDSEETKEKSESVGDEPKEAKESEEEAKPETVEREATPPPPPKEKKWKKKISRHFLVKWRGLGYEDSTWELEDDIDPAKIEHFYRFRLPPPKNEWKIKKKPKSTEWKKMPVSPAYKNGNTLRPYQLEGVNWLMFCWHNQQNCILADEMGLGKTIQSITFVQEMVKFGVPYPYLIIVPLSTIGNWQREFETWTDLNVVTYHGSSPSRNMIQEYELYYKNDKGERIPGVYKFQVMITTFEVILSDCLELSKIKFVACIIDEAHRLKNRNCKLLEGLRMLSIDHRVLLTGTPLQNNVEELFSLLNYLDPNKFTSNESFLAEFGDLKTEAQVDKLKSVLKPMMLRRLKEDVEKSLAPKEETIVEVELTNVQKKYYRAILEKNFQFLSKGGTNNNMPNLMNTVMELRKCCIHPFLINGAEDQIIDEFRQQQRNSEGGTVDAIIAASGKLVLIDKLLPKLKANGHRVLIFSQMVRCLDILEDYLCQRRYPYERIDGRVRGNLRQAAIDRFSRPDSDRFVFLLCTRAGGLGINLTAADTVIIFDSDWNPQNDLQAQARCHRIGQKKMVKIYRLICRNTYEREMFDRASLKLGLDKAVLQSMNTAKNGGNDQAMTKKEIEDLLRKGAYGALMDDDNAGDKFCEEDIDTILRRRTMNIVIESEGKGSTFSKATFATSDNRTDIDIDDPNFWEKWAKKANLDADEMTGRNELIVEEPRRRTQTKRFGADDGVGDFSDLDTSDEEEEGISARTRGGRTRSSKKKGGKSSRSRGYDPDHDEDYASEIGFGWNRYEFFRVEKGLLTFGWGRWNECLIQANFKRPLQLNDVEDMSRIILLFALQTYKGDEKLKQIILEMIVPESERNDETEALFSEQQKNRNRRKPKELAKTVSEELEAMEWTRNEKYNPELHLPDEYRKHLLRHANKILLRVRLLAYIKNDIIGDYGMKALSVANVSEIPLPYAAPDCDPPAPWWDEEADKSLLIGTFKHGYDRYIAMRQDPALCFLSRCGPLHGFMDESNAEDGKTPEDEDTENSTLAEKNDQDGDIETVKSQESLDDSVDSKLDTETSESETKKPEEGEDDSEAKKPEAEEESEKKSEEIEAVEASKAEDEKVESEKETTENDAAKEVTDKETVQNDLNDKESEEVSKEVSAEEKTSEEKMETDGEANNESVVTDAEANGTLDESSKYAPFPPVAELNNRLRRLLTSYQKNFKKEEAKNAQKARNQLRMEKMEKYEAVMREKESKKREQAQKVWSRREETDFYKTVSSYGVDYNRTTKTYDWNRFRVIAKLERKIDETLTEYYRAFYAMCKKAVGRVLTEEDENLPISVDPISEDKANRCLVRIDLLSKIREETLLHPELEERLKLAQSQLDLPEWWVVGKHDRELLTAAGRYGLSRLEFNLINDPEFSFGEAISVCEAQKEAKRKEYEIERDVKACVEKLLEHAQLIDEGKQIPELLDADSAAKTDDDLINSEAVVRPAIRRLPERVLQVRLENLSYCIDKGEWPSFRGLQLVTNPAPSVATADSSPRPSTPCSMSSQEAPTPDHTPRHETQSPFMDSFYWQQQAQKNSLLTPGPDAFESDPKRRRRGKSRRNREEPVPHPMPMDTSKHTKLQSLLNQQQTPLPAPPQPVVLPVGGKQVPAIPPFPNLAGKLPAPIPSTVSGSSSSASTKVPSSGAVPSSAPGTTPTNNDLLNFTQNLLKNNKSLNSLLSNFQPQYLANIMQSMSPNMQNLDLSKSGMFAGLAGLNSTPSPKSGKGSGSQQPPPPAHQSSSSRNSLPLGTDLTLRFNSSGANTSLDKAAASSSSSKAGNFAVPTNSKTGLFDFSKAADLLDLRAATAGGKNNFNNLLMQQQLEYFKNSSLNAQASPSGLSGAHSSSSSSTTATPTTTTTSSSDQKNRKSTRNGSRIDQLALNLQAKKILQDNKKSDSPSQISTRQSSATSSASATTTPSASSSKSTLPKGLNQKDLMAAFSALSGDKRSGAAGSSSTTNFFEEFAKQFSKQTMPSPSSSKAATLPQSPAFSASTLDAVSKILNQTKTSSNTSTSSSASDPAKTYLSLLESLKGITPPAAPVAKPKPTPTSSATSAAASAMEQNYAKLFKDYPDLLTGNMSSLTNLLSNSLFAQTGLGKGLTSTPKTEEKPKSERSERAERSERGKRTRSQFDPSTLLEESSSKKANMNASPKPNLLDSKYLASLLDKNEPVETKIKNMINEKTKGSGDGQSTSSPRTRISDKQKSSNLSAATANFNAASLFNNLSNLTAGSTSGATGSSSTASSSSSKQQQNSASMLANHYMNLFSNAGGAAGSKSGSNTGSAAAAANPFANFSGLNPSMLAGLGPQMKLFMDLSAAGTAGSSKSSSASTAPSSSTLTNTTSLGTTHNTTSQANSSAQSNPLASFANLFGMNNLNASSLLSNFGGLSGLAGLSGASASSSKKDSSSSSTNPAANIDFASLFNANTASLLAGASADKAKTKTTPSSSSGSSITATSAGTSSGSTKPSSSSSSAASKASTSASLNAAAAMLGQGGLNPLLYQNPSSFASAMSMFNPSLFPNAFFNNPSLMNGLGNFSSVLTPPTSTPATTTASASSSSSKSKSKPPQPETPSSGTSSSSRSKRLAERKAEAAEAKEEVEENEEEANGEVEPERTSRSTRRDRAKRSTSK